MIEVFKTNVEDPLLAKHIAAQITKKLPHSRVSFDLEDCDKILRIECSHQFSAEEIVELLHRNNINAEILL